VARPPAAAAKRRILFEEVLACFDKERIRYVDCFEKGLGLCAREESLEAVCREGKEKRGGEGLNLQRSKRFKYFLVHYLGNQTREKQCAGQRNSVGKEGSLHRGRAFGLLKKQIEDGQTLREGASKRWRKERAAGSTLLAV